MSTTVKNHLKNFGSNPLQMYTAIHQLFLSIFQNNIFLAIAKKVLERIQILSFHQITTLYRRTNRKKVYDHIVKEK
jgi:hypothetical protein